MRRIRTRIGAAVIAVLLAAAPAYAAETEPETETAAENAVHDFKTGGFSAHVSVHDPSVFRAEDGTYYIFGSHMETAKSSDLKFWRTVSTGVNERNRLFSDLFSIPEGEQYPAAFSYTGRNSENGYSVWAPDVIFNRTTGKYMMYFCTTSSYVKSTICFAEADAPEGPYSFRDKIVYSGFTKPDIEKQGLEELMGTDPTAYLMGVQYNNQKYPNAIDPTVFYDKDDRMWMVYGSWSGGIYILEIDPQTGYPIRPEADEENNVDSYYGKRLLGKNHTSIEGPYIFYDEVSGYYYLFVSFGGLNADGGYQVRMFRSEEPDGEYVDAAGQNMLDFANQSKFGVKMMGNYTFPSLSYTYKAPGHNSAFTDDDGKMYLVYHTRFADRGEFHEPRVHQLFRTENGWLTEAPFAAAGEALGDSGYDYSRASGEYYVINHGLDISPKVKEAELKSFAEDGNIYNEAGEAEGSYTLSENGPYITLKTDSAEYEGVLIEMPDEAGNNTLCFSAVGNNNETVWGVMYLDE